MHAVQLAQFFLFNLHNPIIRCSGILVFQHGRDGLVGQLHRVHGHVDLRLFDTFDEVLAVLRALRFRELGDGFLTHRLGFLVVVEIGAVVAVVFVLVHHVPRNQRGDFGRERVVLVLCLQILHRGLVSVIFPQDRIDEAKTLEVVVNQHIFILVFLVVGDEVLIDL